MKFEELMEAWINSEIGWKIIQDTCNIKYKKDIIEHFKEILDQLEGETNENEIKINKRI